LLTRPAGLPPREEFDHPANAFLWRLPRDVYGAGQTYDREAQVRTILRSFLNEQLQTDPPVPNSVGSIGLIARLGEALNYRVWREEQARRGMRFADAEATVDERIRQALRRFE
jgi:hypothetical protein